MSFHNMLANALYRWQNIVAACFSHPREVHLIPMMVAAGAGGASRKVMMSAFWRRRFQALHLGDGVGA